jgi:hypothetical protein
MSYFVNNQLRIIDASHQKVADCPVSEDRSHDLHQINQLKTANRALTVLKNDMKHEILLQSLSIDRVSLAKWPTHRWESFVPDHPLYHIRSKIWRSRQLQGWKVTTRGGTAYWSPPVVLQKRAELVLDGIYIDQIQPDDPSFATKQIVTRRRQIAALYRFMTEKLATMKMEVWGRTINNAKTCLATSHEIHIQPDEDDNSTRRCGKCKFYRQPADFPRKNTGEFSETCDACMLVKLRTTQLIHERDDPADVAEQAVGIMPAPDAAPAEQAAGIVPAPEMDDEETMIVVEQLLGEAAIMLAGNQLARDDEAAMLVVD